VPASVRVLFFAQYAELVGRDEALVAVPMPATVSDVVREVRAGLEGAQGIPERPLTALNANHAQLDQSVQDGDEVALLPPLAGG
jgi:molybdopterin converting factor small subunit